MLTILMLLAGASAAPPPAPAYPGEDAVDPYVQSDDNAGADPFSGARMLAAFGGQEGVTRIVNDFHARNLSDPRIADIFRGMDHVRLRRVLAEQFCYLLGGDCHYSGRDMKSAHEDMGLQNADMNALVENLQAAMDKEGVPFSAQNKFLSKLAPMRPEIIER